MRPIGIIVKDRDILRGTPVFRGTRVPLQALVGYLEADQSIERRRSCVSRTGCCKTRRLRKVDWNGQALRTKLPYAARHIVLYRGDRAQAERYDLDWTQNELMRIRVIVHKVEEGGFWSEVPSIPGCAT